MAESRTNVTEASENIISKCIDKKNVEVRVTAVEVPVSSIPVGSLINVGTGETYNLISSEQIQLTSNGEFVCVENNCNRSNIKNNETWHTLVPTEPTNINAAHVVIQSANNINSSPESIIDKIHYSYEEAINLPVLHVRCKSTNAELHKDKFGSGGRGRCIKLNNDWLTPSEFEAFGGRASSKDWKRSIRFGGRSLQTLIDEQILVPHATSCTCSNCCDDVNAAGPVRLFTPYKRHIKPVCTRKRQRIGESGSNEDDSCDSDRVENWNTEESAEIITPDHTSNINRQNSKNGADVKNMKDMFRKLHDMSSNLIKIAHGLKNMIKATELKWNLEKQELESKLKNINNETSAQTSNYGTSINIEDSVRLPVQSTADGEETKKCANCNREATRECSSCRRTPYCSSFCQRKDWPTHQVNCNVKIQSEIMLLVDSQ